MSHYHLPYRGLPQEIIEEIFKYSLRPPNSITIKPKNNFIAPIPKSNGFYNFDCRFIPESHRRKIYDGNVVDHWLKDFTFKINAPHAFGLFGLNRDQYEVTRRILCQNGVVCLPLFLPSQWTRPILRSLPPMKHISFSSVPEGRYQLEIIPKHDGKRLVWPFTEGVIHEDVKLESLTFKMKTMCDQEVDDFLQSYIIMMQDGKITELRLQVSELSPAGFEAGELFTLYEYLLRFLPSERQAHCRNLIDAFSDLHDDLWSRNEEHCPEWHLVCDSHEKAINEAFLEAGLNLYKADHRPGEEDAVVALRVDNSWKPRRTIKMRRRKRADPDAVYSSPHLSDFTDISEVDS